MNMDALLTTLRGMLNADHVNLMSVFSVVETWPPNAQRAVAFHYLQGYVEQHLPNHVNQTRLPQVESMILDASSNILYDHAGAPLKQLQCPMNACWQDMRPVDEQDRQRHCKSCRKHVFNTRGLSGAQVRELLDEDPARCLFIDERDGHVRVVYPHQQLEATRRISTVYTEHEMNLAIELGLKPWVHSMRRHLWDHEDKFQFLQVWQHSQTHHVYFQTNMRQPPQDSAWQPALSDISYPSEHYSEPPVAAYLLPHDLEVGERVRLQEPIDLLFQFSGRLDNAQSKYAVWTGESFDIERDIEIPEDHWQYCIVG